MNKRLRTRLGIGLMLLIGALTAAVRMTADAAEAPGDRWTAEELGVLASMRLSQLPPAPVDPSNAVESLPAAVAFGKRLFHDPRFSRNQAVSCASCHAPDRQFQDGLPLGRGVATGTRRSMPIVGAAHSPWLFWDGRKDSLWAQALGPLEDAAEHGGNRTRYVQLIRSTQVEPESVFGAMPTMPTCRAMLGAGLAHRAGGRRAMAPAARCRQSRVRRHGQSHRRL